MKYSLTVTNEHSQTVYIPKEIFKPSMEQIFFGTISCACSIQSHSYNDHDVIMSKDVYEQLHIPRCSKVHLFTDEERIYVGPLIGIFTAGFTESNLRPIGNRSLFFAKLLAVEEAIGAYAYVFGAHHICWEKGLVTGYFYTDAGWKQLEVPLPNVVYDRLPNRKTENQHYFKHIKERLQREYSIPWYNPGFFNKWSIHEQLITDHSISHFLPETERYADLSQLNDLLKKYRHVYLKPINGSLGYGVFQLFYVEDEKCYYCRYRDKFTKNRLQKFPNLESMINHLFKQNQLQQYIVQQGISLLRINGRTVDFRIHTNKNREGNWQVSVIAAKIAGKGSATTHLKNGGMVKTIEEVFPNDEQRADIIDRLTDAVISLSKSIEIRTVGLIGEIGFDIGIDKELNIWLFEANSKPGRAIFNHPKLHEYDLLSRKLSMLFAIYLTEKSILEPEVIFQ
ncbi:YheC/YheD family endospore coat-associated protein [Cytobacillus sp. Hm23]